MRWAVFAGEAVHPFHDLPVIVKGLVGLDAAHDVDLGHARLEFAFAVGDDLVERHPPGTGLRCVVAEECVFIDDVPANIEAALNIGMKGIVFHDDVKELRRKLAQMDVNIRS